ncbi:hypothetical protein F2Q69_00045080 [Brassica cretica]|uniref:Uncharacterized protein n=1 Tax=Brassica cretica TaxID=69181 RepID=A0A8S9NQR5_BRACR|nr:hypothetical protein F2Q69_00045080 [Brassica cretica]
MDSSSTITITREELNAFHLYDRALFSRLVITLRRDIGQSYQVMTFLLYLETIAPHLRNLIADFASLTDVFVNMVADQVVTCIKCLSYDDFPAFVTHLRRSILSPAIPYITDVTRGYLTLIVIHNNRENILFEMKKHLTRVCIRAFEDICVRAEMYNKEIEERENAIAEMSQLGISSVVQNGESSTSQFSIRRVNADNRTIFLTFSKGYPISKAEVYAYFTRENAIAEMSQLGISSVVQNGESSTSQFSIRRVNADNRTIFLTFSKGYPISKAEVYAYFTRRFGEIVEAIHMGGAGENEQTLYATMQLSSVSKVPDILTEDRTQYIINGKHVWARKFIPSHKSS